jgi:hypothetical protein
MFIEKSQIIVSILVLSLALAACSPEGVSAPDAVPVEIPNSSPSAPAAQPVSNERGQPGQPPAEQTSTVNTPYTIVDTGQSNCYDNQNATACPQEGQAFYGQDAQYAGIQPRYVDNGDGTITDLNTGLMWQQSPDLDNKSTYAEAVAGAETFNLAGHDDWRLPTIKELYSLIDFNGSQFTKTPYIDTDYFDFRFGEESRGERTIDAQYWSSTEYLGTVFGGMKAVFGVNFADGRIKGYGLGQAGGREMTQFIRYVRGNPDYGTNDFDDNGNDTITDLATGLMWMQNDSGTTMNWEGALSYCENLEYAGYDDWRLPNAKELQSIVDYNRAPDAADPAQQGPAIDPIFDLTEAESWFWTSTTLLEAPPNMGTGSQAAYVTFGQAFGVQNGNLINVHGAGAQRSDPKSGDPADWAGGHGPQSDEIRIYNYARCVRNGAQSAEVAGSGIGEPDAQPPGDNQPPSGEQSPMGGQPPAEAISACNGLSQSATCQFNSPHGTITGTCQEIQSQLACVPQGGPPGSTP